MSRVVTDNVAAGDTTTETVGAAGAGGDYALRLRNATAASWTTRLRVDTDSTPRFDGVYTLAPDSTAVVRLRDRRAYTASMRVLDGSHGDRSGHAGRLRLPQRRNAGVDRRRRQPLRCP